MTKYTSTLVVKFCCQIHLTALVLLAGILYPGCNRNGTRPSQGEKEKQERRPREETSNAEITGAAPPLKAEGNWSVTLEIPASRLSQAIQRIKFAIGDKTPRYDLNGVVVEVRDERIFFVATDGARMSVVEWGSVGANGAEVPISHRGDVLTTRLNSHLVIPFLRLVGTGDQLTVYVKDDKSGVVFSAGDKWRYVVMPVAAD